MDLEVDAVDDEEVDNEAVEIVELDEEALVGGVELEEELEEFELEGVERAGDLEGVELDADELDGVLGDVEGLEGCEGEATRDKLERGTRSSSSSSEG